VKPRDTPAHYALEAGPALPTGGTVTSGGSYGRAWFWTTGEDMILRQVYPLMGCSATRAMLPRRSQRAIYARAEQLGLTAPKVSRKGMAKWQYQPTEAIDQLLQERYPSCSEPGMLEALAVECSRPSWWLKRRATALGLQYGRHKQPDWSPAEEALLADNSHLGLSTLRRKLAALGSSRTEIAISVRLKKLELSRANLDTYSAAEVGRLLGVDDNAVRRWIRAGNLRANRTPGSKSAEAHWQITRRALREWIAAHPVEVDLRRVDKYWFIDLAFSRGDKA
jgi:excisionase family DNA binding protein